jgi:tryptophan synthase alpha chain
MTGRLGAALLERRRSGSPALVVYLTGGLPDLATLPRLIEAVVAAGADAIEVGIPFSDPIMDGPVIQAASQRALDAGATPQGVIDAVAAVADIAPIGFMTYANIVSHAGYRRFASSAATAGLCAAIVPDLPLEEVGPWLAATNAAGIEAVLLAAPTTPDERLARIAHTTRGFLYAVGTMGVTGERSVLARTAVDLAARAKRLTDKTVLVGVGVSDGSQAVEASQAADGVVVGSALVRRILDADSPAAAVDAAAAFVAGVRADLDSAAVVQPPPDPGCDLCAAERLTHWYHEDELCWVAECEICGVPMVVWRSHGMPGPGDEAAMLARLRAVATDVLGVEGEKWYVDGFRRNIPDHWHAHARRKWTAAQPW